jgi:hypothetical protein
VFGGRSNHEPVNAVGPARAAPPKSSKTVRGVRIWAVVGTVEEFRASGSKRRARNRVILVSDGQAETVLRLRADLVFRRAG